jgi:hypothetical protein
MNNKSQTGLIPESSGATEAARRDVAQPLSAVIPMWHSRPRLCSAADGK